MNRYNLSLLTLVVALSAIVIVALGVKLYQCHAASGIYVQGYCLKKSSIMLN